MIGRKAITGQTRSVKPQKQYKNHTIFGQTSHFREAWEPWYGKRSCDKKHTRKRVPRTYRTKKHKKITDSTSCDPAFRHFNLRQLSKTTYAVWNWTERGQQSSIGFFRNPTCSCFVYLCIYSLVLRLQSLKSAWMLKKFISESGTGIWDGHDRALSHLMNFGSQNTLRHSTMLNSFSNCSSQEYACNFKCFVCPWFSTICQSHSVVPWTILFLYSS